MAPTVVTVKAGPVDLQATSIRLPRGMVGEIDAIAKETGRSRNETFAILLRHAIDTHRGPAASPEDPKKTVKRRGVSPPR